MRVLLYVISALIGLLAFLFACQMGSRGNAWVLLVPILISTIGMGVVRLIGEPDESLKKLYDPQTQSWAFLFGDLLALPLAYAMLAVFWRSVPQDSWFRSHLWLLLSFVAGVVIACVWHFMLDGPGYKKDGYGDLLGSPTKLWHDFVVYGSLSGVLVYLGVSMLIINIVALFGSGSVSWVGWASLLGLIAWGFLGYADNSFHKLYPPDLHPPKSETILR